MSDTIPHPQGRSDRVALAAVLISLLFSGAWVWVLSSGPPSPAAARDGGKVPARFRPPAMVRPALPSSARVLDAGKDGLILVPELVEVARQLNAPESTVEQDFEILGTLIEGYRHAYNGAGPPGGENEEIIAQLSGQNPKHLVIIPPDLPAINAEGRLLDRWGTPFYFHPVSAAALDIRSAGPDQKLWTADDALSGDP